MFLQCVTKPVCREKLLTRLLILCGFSVAAISGTPALAQDTLQLSTYGNVRAVDSVDDSDADDLAEEDGEAATDRADDDCNNKPYCDWLEGSNSQYDFQIVTMDPTVENCFPFEADVFCGESMHLTLIWFIFPYYWGNHADEVSPRQFCNTIPADTYSDGDFAIYTLIVKDNNNGNISLCVIKTIFEEPCNERPECYYNGELINGHAEQEDRSREHYIDYGSVQPGDVIDLEVCARSACEERARVEMFSRPPFLDPIGHRKGGVDEKVCIAVENDVVESGYAEGTYWAKFRCVDLESGAESILNVGFTYSDPVAETCDDPPSCDIDSDSLTVAIGSTDIFEVCSSSSCDDCAVTIDSDALPSFVALYDDAEDRGGAGDVCATYLVSPTDTDAGAYLITFTSTDCDGNESECSVEIMVPAPLLACQENEGQLPNDSFADASVIDAGNCSDAYGVNLYGALDTPVVTNGDVDYFRVVNLTPGVGYEATIVAGMNSDHGFTDTMLGWFVADGITTAMDDNSGPLAGYSKIAFTADENGVATLAIAGHGDDDFNGMMDGSMEYEEYGFGGYMLSIRAEAGDVMPLETQADLNADGIIDTGDLGILLGLFGFSSN